MMEDVFGKISNYLQIAIDTGNADCVAAAMACAHAAMDEGKINILQLQSLETDAEEAGYDF